MSSTIATCILLVACVLPKALASERDRPEFKMSTKPNAPFVALYFFQQKPISVTIGGVEVPEGSLQNSCTTGNSCWEALSDRQCSILLAIPQSGQGSIILYPSDSTKFASAIVVKTNVSDVQDDLLPSGLGEVLKPPLDESRGTLVTLVYGEKVTSTTVLGKMKFLHDAKPPYDGSTLRVPYLDGECKGKIGVLVTGKIENTVVDCVLNFSEKESALIVITPDEQAPESTILHVPFIASSGASSSTTPFTTSHASHLLSLFLLCLAVFLCARQ
ncbi:hypothetical protein AAHC03_022582 [Spirometra sp. Aus1]